MNTKVSKAQLDVWEAKELLSNELMLMPISQRVDYIIQKAKIAVKKITDSKAIKKAA